MERIEVNVSTGERTVITLSAEEEAAALAYAAEVEAVQGPIKQRRTTDEQERVLVCGEGDTPTWLNKTPDEAAQWVTDTFQARVTAGDTQVAAVLFILRRLVRLLLIAARLAARQ